jgi:hypothetical protein
MSRDDLSPVALELWRRIIATRDVGDVAPVLKTEITPDSGQDNLHTALVRMCVKIAVADHYCSHVRPDKTAEMCGVAITAVMDFLDCLDVRSSDWAGPLIFAKAALVELCQGTTPPMVRARHRGRPRDSSKVIVVKSCAAAAMSALMRSGLKREQAAKRVAATLHLEGVRKTNGSRHPWRTVAAWRDEVKAQPPGSPMATVYPGVMRGFEKFPEKDERFRVRVLAKLSEFVSPRGFQKSPYFFPESKSSSPKCPFGNMLNRVNRL